MQQCMFYFYLGFCLFGTSKKKERLEKRKKVGGNGTIMGKGKTKKNIHMNESNLYFCFNILSWFVRLEQIEIDNKYNCLK